MAKEAADSPDSLSSSRASNQERVLRSSTRQAVAVYSKRENSYSPPLKAKAKKRKKKSTKADAKMPKKPPTAFFYFLEDFRKEFQQQNPDVKSMRDVGKACGEKWKTMTYEEKVKYYDIATEKRAEFDKAMAEYIRKKETSEDQETEDDDSEYNG